MALMLICLVEGAYWLAAQPTFSERANFGLLNRFHDAVLFGKLARFEHSSPDVVQIGDSSGFHGVRPEIVMKYLGGLKYLNLSCCANTGYRGYFGIADFMLRRNSSIKAVVLYISLHNLPREELITGDHQMGETIQNALTAPWAYLSPPTMALRQTVVEMIQRKRQSKIATEFIDEMRLSTQQHHGWWAEHDRRLAGAKRIDYWRGMCGETGILSREDAEQFYSHDFISSRRSSTLVELERLARLVAHHGAKLVVLLHPFSCSAFEGDFITARRLDVRSLMARNSNVVVLPDQMVEPWPTERFIIADHLRTGYDEENSRRVGRLLAQALGIRLGSDTVEESAASGPADPSTEVRLPAVHWRADGIRISPANEQTADESLLFIEAAGPGLHHVKTTLTDMGHGPIHILSFVAKPVGNRGIRVNLQSKGRNGGGYCDLPGMTAQRYGDALDVGLEERPDGWLRCWIALQLDDTSAVLDLSLVNEELENSYAGNGESGVAIREINRREATRLVSGESSPW